MKLLWFKRISTRLVLLVWGPLAVLYLATFAAAQYWVSEAFSQRLENEVALVGHALQNSMGRAVEYGQTAEIIAALDSVERLNDVYSVEVFSAEGTMVATTRPDLEHADLSGEAVAEILQGAVGHSWQGELSGRRVHKYVLPLPGVGNNLVGFMQLTRLRANVEEFVRLFRLLGAALFLGCFVLAMVVVRLGYERAVGRALRRVLAQIEGIAQGNEVVEAFDEGPHEIREISGALESMSTSIRQWRNEVLNQQSEKRTMEKQLAQAEHLAALGRLAGGVAHELGTPLTTLSLHLQRLRRRHTDDPETPDIAASMAQIERMQGIVAKLLDLGRRRHEESAVISVRDAAVHALSSIEDPRLEIEIEQGDLEVEADSLRLEQAISNLVSNALETHAVERVRLRISRDASRVRIEVDDDGSGVPVEMRERILEPFVSDRTDRGGTGLGLSIVDAVAGEVGGSLHVSDSPDLGGARFVVTLPLLQRSPSD